MAELVKTIKITTELKSRLDKEKVHPRQSYDEIINQLLENATRTNPKTRK